MRFAFKVVLSILAACICGGCAAVDQYQARVDDANLNSQNALNNETLLNIVRSSRFESLISLE